MIRKIYIINDEGLCIFFLDYSTTHDIMLKNSFDPQLIAGFFSAIISFAEESVGGPGSDDISAVNFISIRNLHYTFLKKNSRFFIIESDAMDKKPSGDDIKEILLQIMEIFNKFIQNGRISVDNFQIITCLQLEDEIKSCIARAIRRSLFKEKKL